MTTIQTDPAADFAAIIIDPTDALDALAEARSNLDMAQADYADAEQTLEGIEDDLHSGADVTATELLEVRTLHEVAKAKLDNATRKFKAAERRIPLDIQPALIVAQCLARVWDIPVMAAHKIEGQPATLPCVVVTPRRDGSPATGSGRSGETNGHEVEIRILGNRWTKRLERREVGEALAEGREHGVTQHGGIAYIHGTHPGPEGHGMDHLGGQESNRFTATLSTFDALPKVDGDTAKLDNWAKWALGSTAQASAKVAAERREGDRLVRSIAVQARVRASSSANPVGDLEREAHSLVGSLIPHLGVIAGMTKPEATVHEERHAANVSTRWIEARTTLTVVSQG